MADNSPRGYGSAAIGGAIFAAVAAFGFSAKAIFVKVAYLEHVDAVTLLALRMAFALPFFVGLAVWTGRQAHGPLMRGDRALIVILGLLGYYLASLLDFMGLQFISAGLERLILFLYPTLTVVLTALAYRRTVRGGVLAAMALSYSGIALAFLHDIQLEQPGLVLGASLVFASTVAYALYLVIAERAVARIGAARFAAYPMIVACLAAILHFVLSHPLGDLTSLPRSVFGWALAMAVGSTVVPVVMLSLAIRRIGAGHTALIGSIGPVVTIALAYVLLGESVSALQLLGAALVVTGVLLVSLDARRKAE